MPAVGAVLANENHPWIRVQARAQARIESAHGTR